MLKSLVNENENEKELKDLFQLLPWWFWRLVSIYSRKEATPYVVNATEYRELLDEFGRVEFLPPCHGC